MLATRSKRTRCLKVAKLSVPRSRKTIRTMIKLDWVHLWSNKRSSASIKEATQRIIICTTILGPLLSSLKLRTHRTRTVSAGAATENALEVAHLNHTRQTTILLLSIITNKRHPTGPVILKKKPLKVPAQTTISSCKDSQDLFHHLTSQ